MILWFGLFIYYGVVPYAAALVVANCLKKQKGK